ncbi:DNA-3-methyladenine glycosylase [Streptomyces alkaliphilus]|uniref:DNA-3-methyladenine glycosylase n=1 Tax=Streptomyces alkaliphilus TaxID=1472722 RepID=UPI0011809F4A|nr:DNA-3-methyladenine glycosylase [Streptomyces alkaliphilus]MQS08270.1 DNA-3-methyladenine glycosylase [Streptomyces alkaliphilus]
MPRAFLDRPVTEVAPELLGAILVRNTPDGAIAVRLTEVEAYGGGDDPGSHSYRGRTARNASMFGPPGHAYVYFTYGMWHCLNIVCGPVGHPSGVLLRAGEVVEGGELAVARRPRARAHRDLARGPARLATALAVDRELDGTDVCTMVTGPGEVSPLELWRASDPPCPDAVRRGPRTGVGGAGAARPWRFWIDGDPSVSPYRAHQPRRRTGSSAGVDTGPRSP